MKISSAFALSAEPDDTGAKGWRERPCQRRELRKGGVRSSVDGWRRHVLISWCVEAAQPWSSSSFKARAKLEPGAAKGYVLMNPGSLGKVRTNRALDDRRFLYRMYAALARNHVFLGFAFVCGI